MTSGNSSHRTLCRLALCLFAGCICLFSVRAQDVNESRSRKERLEKEIALIQKQLDDNSKKSKGALNELTLIRKQLSNRRELVNDSERELKVIQDSILRSRKQIKTLEARLDTLNLQFQRLLRGAYRNRDTRMWYVYLLTSGSIPQASRRYAYLRSLSSTISARSEEIKLSREEMQKRLTELEAMKKRAEDLRDSRRKELEKLSADEKRSDKVVAQLKKDKSRYEKELSTKRKQVESLNREIERLIAEQLKSSSPSGSGQGKKKAAEPIDYKLSGEFEQNKGKLPWPAEGPVVEKFGRHKHPVYTSLVMPFNNGINIALNDGQEVKAVFDGVVKSIVVMPGYNMCVLVQHGGYFTFYCKLADVRVKSGDKVKTGTVLGNVAPIDSQTQLHCQVWKQKEPQDPQLWLRPR